jgi:hypothetical protein
MQKNANIYSKTSKFTQKYWQFRHFLPINQNQIIQILGRKIFTDDNNTSDSYIKKAALKSSFFL